MKILLLGYSNIVRKRMINFFLKKKIKFCIASKSYKGKIDGCYDQFDSYEKAILKSKANIVHISLPNSLHFYWAKKALKKNYHVIVDKPICINFKQTKELIKLSRKKKRLIVEATYFNYHNQVKQLLKICSNKKIYNINSKFVIPFPKKGIRTSNKLGGGALMDMGPYISAVPRLFNLKKIKSKKITISKNKNGLIYALDFEFNFDRIKYSGFFKFGGDYTNELTVNMKNKSIKIQRVFSPPDDKNLFLRIKQKNKIKKIKIKKDNCFGNFFKEVKSKIKFKKNIYYHDRILKDSYFRNKIIK